MKSNFKKSILLIALTVLYAIIAISQTPQSINYQAIARNGSGALMANSSINARFTIHQGSASGTTVYQETHAVTTNDYALFSVKIGEGTVSSGSFAAIDWANNAYYLQVEIDAGSGYTDMGSNQLVSVPYSLYSAEAANVITYTGGSGISVSGNTISNTAPDQTVNLTGSGATSVSGTYPNFTISSTDNNTTYTGGSGISVSGNTISNTAPDQTVGLSGSGATTVSGTYPNFTITSTDDNTTYSAGSGLALTGTTFSNIAPDQTVNLTGSGATSVSGTYPNFTISSTDNNTTYQVAGSGVSLSGTLITVHSSTAYWNANKLQGKLISTTAPTSGQVLKWDGTYWTPAAETIDDNDWQVSSNTVFVDSSKTVETGSSSQPRVSMHAGRIAFLNTGYSVYIGEGAGAVDNIALGKNTGTGFKTLNHNNSGSSNTATGYNALFYNTSGSNNVATGYAALNNNTSGNNNTASGPYGMYNNTTGLGNAAFGDHTLFSNTSGHSNIAIGNNALYHNTSRSNLVAIGDSALFNNGIGATLYYEAAYNTAIGSKALFSNTTGSYNTANGFYALYYNTTGYANNGIGHYALSSNTTGNYNTTNGYNALYHNTTGSANTGIGIDALISNTTGNDNTANGAFTLYYNTAGISNIAIGTHALYHNTTRSNLVAIGDSALFNNGTGATFWYHASGNTAIGSKALFSNTTGYYNTANGYQALYNNTTGFDNTANGDYALYHNTTGLYNTANGYGTLYHNTTGHYNTANGYEALYNNTTGSQNTGYGMYSGYYDSTQSNNTSVGYSAGDFFTFSSGTFLGANAYPNVSGHFNITGLGYQARPQANNSVRIGNSSVSSIGGYAAWTNLSDARYKKNVQENVHGLDFILQLRPVTYNMDIWKLSNALKEDLSRDEQGNIVMQEADESTRQSRDKKAAIQYTGFIAQEVEEAAKEIGYDFSGVDAPDNPNDFYGLRYAEFVVPLVKAVQEQQKLIKDLQQQIDELKSEINK